MEALYDTKSDALSTEHQSALDRICAHRDRSLAALGETQRQETSQVIPGSGGRLSVCIHDGNVVLVEWFMAVKGKGRVVFLNENRGIVFPMQMRNPWQDLACCNIVLTDCDARPRKVSKLYNRKVLPDTAWVVFQLAQQVVGPHCKFGDELTASEDSCAACDRSFIASGSPTFRCSLCLCSYHSKSGGN